MPMAFPSLIARFGTPGGVPIVFNQHYIGTIDYITGERDGRPAADRAIVKWGVQREGAYSPSGIKLPRVSRRVLLERTGGSRAVQK
jgi:hypothetical protein